MNMSLGLLDMASPAGEGVLLYLWATSACLNYPIVSFLYYTTPPRPSYSPLDLLQHLTLVLRGPLARLERLRQDAVPGAKSLWTGETLCSTSAVEAQVPVAEAQCSFVSSSF